jgi:hypothetical protein
MYFFRHPYSRSKDVDELKKKLFFWLILILIFLSFFSKNDKIEFPSDKGISDDLIELLKFMLADRAERYIYIYIYLSLKIHRYNATKCLSHSFFSKDFPSISKSFSSSLIDSNSPPSNNS